MDRDTRKWLSVIVGFLGLMAVANAVLLSSALKGHGNDPVPEAYSRGLKWNQTQEALQNSKALGWQVKMHVTGSGENARLELSVMDGAHQPITLDTSDTVLTRPSNDQPTQTLSLKPSATPGVYEAPVKLAVPGLWELQGVLKRGHDEYLTRVRMDVPASAVQPAKTL